jgi:hypothetical protein
MSRATGSVQPARSEALEGVLDEVADSVGSSERVSIGEIVTALNDRGFGALCALIGVLASIPVIGALPGVSLLAAVLVLLIAGQHAAGRHRLWIPSALSCRSVSSEKFAKGIERAKPYVSWVDGLVSPRLRWLVEGRTERRLIAVAMCILALTMIPLALIPWGVFAPALAITAFGIAIVGRDGLFAAAGYALTAVTVYLCYAFWNIIESMLAAL